MDTLLSKTGRIAVCVIALCFAGCSERQHSAQDSGSAAPPPQRPSGNGEADARAEAQRLFESQWIRRGDYWYAFPTDYRTNELVCLKGLTVDVECDDGKKHFTPTEADKLNGVQWRGFLLFSAAAERSHLPTVGWEKWRPGSRIALIHAECTKGTWETKYFFVNVVTWMYRKPSLAEVPD